MSDTERDLSASDLNKVIAPEIKGDAFHALIEHLSSTETLSSVLEIGSSSGGGSTGAFVSGLAANPGSPKLFCIEISKPRFENLAAAYKAYPFVHCYNRSTVSVDQFPSPQDVAEFYTTVETTLNQYPLEQVLDWLRQDIQYVREAGVEADAIAQIKADHCIDTFDMVLIDGSEFTGSVEYEMVRGARLILLDDTNTYKCHAVRALLLRDPMYDVIADDQALRNGYSAFRRRAEPRRETDVLPIHFFTIVLNGEPFIRFHEEVFRRLEMKWHWHIVEGVAQLRHDTAWSVAAGGHISDSFHDRGRSNDGTSAYLDDLARRFPDNITLYRKPLDTFWDGKKEMVNAPLPNISEECLLWQVDNDELWTAEQIATVHRMFLDNPERTAAFYWCWYFVGPDRIISTRYNYAQNPNQEWLRTWRYRPGAYWAAHEPPILTIDDAKTGKPTDLAKIYPYTQDETEDAGAVFQHFAYATETQVAFKELYYGYKGAREQWRALQAGPTSGALKDYFGWVSDNTVFDRAEHYPFDPIAWPDPVGGAWVFDNTATSPLTRPTRSIRRPRIVVDGIFWQHLSSGIGRVWENLLRAWVKTGFADTVVMLDRDGTAPRIPGVHYWSVPAHDYAQTGQDSLTLERACRLLGADLFASTYYSTPTTTPSFFVGHDMIPEVLGFPLDDEAWQEKRRAIVHAVGHSMVSRNSARDLELVYPELPRDATYVTYCAADRIFFPPTDAELNEFLTRHGLKRGGYLLMVGERSGFGGYKNCAIAFRALARLGTDSGLTLVCVGGAREIEPEFRKLAPQFPMKHLRLDDVELRSAYGGAHALLYPSLYEGFGMPPLESLACGTPVIVCRKASIPEVVGDAAMYVSETNPAGIVKAIQDLFDPGLRADLIARGLRQAERFSFETMARDMAAAFEATCGRLRDGSRLPPGSGWMELRRTQRDYQTRTLEVSEDGETSSARFTASRELNEARRTIAAMRSSPFWRARELVVRILRKAALRHRS